MNKMSKVIEGNILTITIKRLLRKFVQTSTDENNNEMIMKDRGTSIN